jgi:hypothetical protein
VLGAAGALLLIGLALAGQAAAMEDPRRPAAAVTHGPSCGPGAVRVHVTNGTEAHRVALVFDGTAEQDSTVLAAEEQAELRSADVDWGVTVDVSVTVTSADGPGEPLELGTYTRPSRADCDAVGTAGNSPAPSTAGGPTAGPSADGAPATSPPATSPPATSPPAAPTAAAPTIGAPAWPAPSTGATRTPGRPDPSPTPTPTPGPASSTSSPPGAPSAGSPPRGDAAGPVAPGGVVTLRGTGFLPGEPVHVEVPGLDESLTTVTAGADGTVEAVVQIPRETDLGPLTIQLVGQDSAATTGLNLQVAARQTPRADTATPVPVLAAGAVLLAAGAVLGLYAAGRPRDDAAGPPARRS